MEIVDEIREIVNRETKAWDTKDVNLLLSIFHSDMVWFWTKSNKDFDPINWEAPLGKFDFERWKEIYSKMFVRYDIIKNERNIVDIKIAEGGAGAMAIVDVDTLWQDKDGKQMHWLGRAGKIYTKTDNGWKLISHIGLLQY